MGMLGVLGMYARVRTKMRKVRTVYLVLRKKKVHIRGLGRMLISCASESGICKRDKRKKRTTWFGQNPDSK